VTGLPTRSPAQPGERAALRVADENAPKENKATAQERRRSTRREPDRARAFTGPKKSSSNKDWLPRRWKFLVLVYLGIIGACIGAADSLPDRQIAALLGLAVASLLPVANARRVADSFRGYTRLVFCIVFVAMPTFLMGLAVSQWSNAGALPIEIGFGALLGVSCIAGAYLRRRPALMFAAGIGGWLGVALTFWSNTGIAMVAGGILLAILISRELDGEQRADEEIRNAVDRAQTRARDILADYEETGQGWFWETDRRGLLTYISTPVAEVVGHEPEDLLGKPLTQLFSLQESGEDGERTLLFHLSARSAFAELDMRAATQEEERWWSVSGRPIYDQYDNFVGFRGSGTDLTERRRSQEHASRLAHYDSLTELANRFQMSQSLAKILNSPQQSNRECAVMLLDLDRFKHVNDTMGHPAGDALLKQVAQRLERTVGRRGKVGRLGGDEFEVIIPTREKKDQLGQLAGDIIFALSQPYSIDGQRVVIGASVGVAIAPQDGTTSDELIRNADLALYAAKDGGRGRYHFYAEDLHAEAEERSKLEEDLRDAITNGDLELYYQPVVSAATEKIAGFEALLRWQHPEKGWINPERFVSIAEDSGMISQIGEWALRQACEDLAKWDEDDVMVAVNVSPLQFANPQLPAMVANAIANSGIAPNRLELEITESVFLSDDEGTDAMFAALKRLGVRLALDDFGTGYSSLGYLKKAPFDKIKIDQSFVRGATQANSRNGAIIASITSLAHTLGMDTTAEGVETMDELELVRLHGCSHIQGFIYERPLSAKDASQRLSTGLAAVARGPRSARAPRQKMLRKVVLNHQGHLYNGTIRNISTTGALIEGLWNVPVGTTFEVQLSVEHSIGCTARWSEEDRIGVEFERPLRRDSTGSITVIQGAAPVPVQQGEIRKAG